MSKIDRYNGNLKAFAADSLGTERTIFGDTAQADTLDANITADFLRGWGIVGVNENPTKQDFNGLAFTLGQLIAYLHQRGVPEWNTSQEYYEGSVVATLAGVYRLLSGGDGTADRDTDGGVNWELAPTRAQVDSKTDQALLKNYFKKTNSSSVLFTKTGNFTATTGQTFYAEAGGSILTIASGTAITMPAATTGTDYAVWLKTDGALEATTNFTTPPATSARKIGGFHYAPGGNAAAQAGGDSTPQINEYSFWDLNYRPACDDPRGMTCVAGSFWSDIYFLNTNPDVNGTSKHGVTIADGSSPPIIPANLGGNGSTTFGSLTWFEAMSIATAMGKKAFTQTQFMTAMYGVTEATASVTDPATTGLDAARTSRWGIMQATGNLWTWAQDRGGNFSTGGWNANTEGYGSEYNAPNASLLGASWIHGVDAGSRASYSNSLGSYNTASLRLACDHLQVN